MNKKDIQFTYCWTSPCGVHLERTGYVTVWIDPETRTWDYWQHSPYYESERSDWEPAVREALPGFTETK